MIVCLSDCRYKPHVVFVMMSSKISSIRHSCQVIALTNLLQVPAHVVWPAVPTSCALLCLPSCPHAIGDKKQAITARPDYVHRMWSLRCIIFMHSTVCMHWMHTPHANKLISWTSPICILYGCMSYSSAKQQPTGYTHTSAYSTLYVHCTHALH